MSYSRRTDYCIVAFAIIIIISTVQWFVDGRKNFTGPRSDFDIEILEAVPVDQRHDSSGNPAKKTVEGRQA